MSNTTENCYNTPMTIQFDESERNKRLDNLYKHEEEELARVLSGRYKIPYADLSVITIDTDALRTIPEERARKARIAGIALIAKRLKVAVQAPTRKETLNEIKELERRGYSVELFMVSTQSLERAWDRYKDISYATESKKGSLDIANDEILDTMDAIKNVEDVQKLLDNVKQQSRHFRISRIVEVTLAGAIATGASDVHIEPEHDDIRVRYRLDGILVDITRLDQETFKLLLSRIKLLSGMKLNIRNAAQDGRFSIVLGEDHEIEVRSSILPGAYNESIVMRLLDPTSIRVPLAVLGIEPYLMKIFMEQISKPNGMILNTGPTGSGKTTTLYAFLREKNKPGIKIITIEDPIEYHLAGIVQTQVDKKKNYTFASGLRASLRQDPDVMMVGEIRDLETAETAIHASLTGHLVFSTLHTNNAFGAYTRLIDLGINPKILTSAINMAIAQRLTRRLCENCKKIGTIDPHKAEIIKKVYDSFPFKPDMEFTTNLYEPVGCKECNGMGYKGRIAVYEAVLSDALVEEVLQTNPSEREIKAAAQKQGILDMAQDGVLKILRGITTVEELERVVNLETREAMSMESINADKKEREQKVSDEMLDQIVREEYKKAEVDPEEIPQTQILSEQNPPNQ